MQFAYSYLFSVFGPKGQAFLRFSIGHPQFKLYVTQSCVHYCLHNFMSHGRSIVVTSMLLRCGSSYHYKQKLLPWLCAITATPLLLVVLSAGLRLEKDSIFYTYQKLSSFRFFRFFML